MKRFYQALLFMLLSISATQLNAAATGQTLADDTANALYTSAPVSDEDFEAIAQKVADAMKEEGLSYNALRKWFQSVTPLRVSLAPSHMAILDTIGESMPTSRTRRRSLLDPNQEIFFTENGMPAPDQHGYSPYEYSGSGSYIHQPKLHALVESASLPDLLKPFLTEAASKGLSKTTAKKLAIEWLKIHFSDLAGELEHTRFDDLKGIEHTFLNQLYASLGNYAWADTDPVGIQSDESMRTIISPLFRVMPTMEVKGIAASINPEIIDLLDDRELQIIAENAIQALNDVNFTTNHEILRYAAARLIMEQKGTHHHPSSSERLYDKLEEALRYHPIANAHDDEDYSPDEGHSPDEMEEKFQAAKARFQEHLTASATNLSPISRSFFEIELAPAVPTSDDAPTRPNADGASTPDEKAGATPQKTPWQSYVLGNTTGGTLLRLLVLTLAGDAVIRRNKSLIPTIARTFKKHGIKGAFKELGKHIGRHKALYIIGSVISAYLAYSAFEFRQVNEQGNYNGPLLKLLNRLNSTGHNVAMLPGYLATSHQYGW